MRSPETRETALHGGSSSSVSPFGMGHRTDSTILLPHRRNSGRHGSSGVDGVALGGGRQRSGGSAQGSLLTATGKTPREAWVNWLRPVFAGKDSCYFTGTYSDGYGFPNGLTLTRNVHKDFERFLAHTGFLDLSERRYVNGVERHAYRDILHLHGILEGPFTKDEMRYLKAMWEAERGWCKALPVLDGCESYVTKYALKGDTDSFEWRL